MSSIEVAHRINNKPNGNNNNTAANASATNLNNNDKANNANNNMSHVNFNNNHCDMNIENHIVDENFEYRGYHKFGRILGRGSFGTVIECVRKCDSKPVAIKLVKRKAIYKWVPESLALIDEKIDDNKNEEKKENRMIPLEVACLIRSSNLNGVVKILEYWPPIDSIQFETDSDVNEIINEKKSPKSEQQQQSNDESVIGIVLERNYNEECLFDYLFEKTCISENEAKVILKQIVEISINLLRIGILHGDLKSENMLIDRRIKRIKLIDFGSAELLDLNNSNSLTKAVKTFRGTNLYKPPEYLLHHCFYPRPSTVWTIGIILFNMVTGEFPFQSENEVLEHKNKEIIFTKKDLSDDLKDLINKCLAFYAADRIVIEKVLLHPWLNNIPN